MFSPIFAIVSEIDSDTVMLPAFADLIFSTSVPTDNATSAIIFTRPWKRSLRATKSVSELTSTTTPLVPCTCTPIRPSAATRPAFLAALDRPFLRSQSCAAVMSPFVSVRAALQSIMPAPVDSRSSLTICALIFAIEPYPSSVPAAAGSRRCINGRTTTALLRRQFLGLGDPARHTARQADFLANVVSSLLVELGDLRVVENAEIVELLLDCRRNAGQFLEIVGDAAGARQLLEAEIGGGRRHGDLLRDDRLFGGADVNAHLTLRARNSVDCRFRNEIAVE